MFNHGLCVHFDIWKQIEENFFLHFSKIHRGYPYDYDQNRKGPPYEFWKNEKNLKKIFFLNFIPDIKMDQKIHYENHFQTYLTLRVGPQ